MIQPCKRETIVQHEFGIKIVAYYINKVIVVLNKMSYKNEHQLMFTFG